MMKRTVVLFVLAIVVVSQAIAQHVTPAVTVFREFKPARVYLSDGKKIQLPLANVFLKNSSLLYKRHEETMEANMKTIERVEFDDRTYYRIDTVLAYRIDTIGSDALYRADCIDFETFYKERANNVDFTNIRMGEMIQFTTRDLLDEGDIHFPVISLYYYRLGGKYVLAHERNVSRLLSKEKKRMMRSALLNPNFSWTSEQDLMLMLKMIR